MQEERNANNTKGGEGVKFNLAMTSPPAAAAAATTKKCSREREGGGDAEFWTTEVNQAWESRTGRAALGTGLV